MISSEGEKGSGVLDVLHSQASDSSAEHSIKIHKIYGNGFDSVKKPTDLDIGEIKFERKSETNDGKVEYSKKEESFRVPKPLLAFLDTLIAKDLPLRTLKFDIEFARSNEEIEGFIQSYIDKSNILSEEDVNKLFSFVGSNKNEQSVNSVEEKPTQDEIPNTSLNEFRIGYAELLVPYLKKIKKNREMYSKIMADLGGNMDMPLQDEPKELTEAREEYKKAKKENGIVGLEDEIVEVEKLRAEVYKTENSKLNSVLNRVFASWDEYPNSGLVATSLLGDVNDLDRIVDPSTFDGMRGENKPKVTETPTETSTVVVEDKSKPEIVPEIKIQEEIPIVEPEKPEIKFEIVGEGQKIEEEAKKIVEGGDKLPVDSVVEEKEVLTQNSSPIEFEGKKLEIVRGQGEDKDSIHIVWGGIEIAFGKITKGGVNVKIDKKFKSGFLLADTMEEKALKHAMPAIKALKLD